MLHCFLLLNITGDKPQASWYCFLSFKWRFFCLGAHMIFNLALILNYFTRNIMCSFILYIQVFLNRTVFFYFFSPPFVLSTSTGTIITYMLEFFSLSWISTYFFYLFFISFYEIFLLLIYCVSYFAFKNLLYSCDRQ